jgi:OOP family OmpA-OmpF porin
MRLRAILFALISLGCAGFGIWKLAALATVYFEHGSEAEAVAALGAAGQDWARVETDGLNVTLAGFAPDETARFRAVEILRQVVDPRRITEDVTVKAADPLAPPPFAIEILRNEAEVSLIGLAPDDGIRERIRAALSAAGLGATVTDMLETAADPAPVGWEPSLAFALDLLVDLPRAKISVAPGSVTVLAAVDSDPDRIALEARLREAVPAGVALRTDIAAPRPVIAPFAVDFIRDDSGARLAACTAETPEAAAKIITAARAAGLAGPQDCAVGLGAPSLDWPRVATLGIETVGALDGGRFTVTDTKATLTGPDSASP